MTEQLPWFKCEPGKLLGALAALSMEEGYLYTVAILRIYENGGPINETSAKLARRCGMSPKKAESALQSLLDKRKLMLAENGHLDCGKTHEFLQERKEQWKNAQNAGFLGAEKRWNKTKRKQRKKIADPIAEAKQPNSDKEEDSSDANASAGRLSPEVTYRDAKHELWGEGKKYLAELGIAESRAAPLIGGWCKETNNDYAFVLDIIRRCRAAKPIDPIPWIVNGLRGSTKKGNGNARTVQDASRDLTDLVASREPGATFGQRPAVPLLAIDGGKVR